ncbi:MAG: hypothetical protein MRJ96_12050 [Nitrospirales bacterium]|nr:hypothetical protein [Nitrospirales bacterium]
MPRFILEFPNLFGGASRKGYDCITRGNHIQENFHARYVRTKAPASEAFAYDRVLAMEIYTA